MPRHAKKQLDAPSLFAAALLVAVGGLIYELILGTAASYLFGDSIVSFSIATGVTLFGMGFGSLISGKLLNKAATNFAWNEILLGTIGGFSVLLLFAAFSLFGLHWHVFILLSLAIGTLIGLEIPLLVSLFRTHGKTPTVKLLGRVLALDYFGALIASLLFPFFLLPTLGLTRTALLVAILNIAIALFILWRLGLPRMASIAAVIALGLLSTVFIYATRIEQFIDARAFRDPVVLTTASPYQRIVMTQFGDDTRLYLNNQLQFSSRDEARYHETLVHAAITSVKHPARVAILGGGDGIAVREILKYPDVHHVTLIDIDPVITDLARKNPVLTRINQNSLADPRVVVRNEDAMMFMKDTSEVYDVIIADFIDPANERAAKLYSKEFYQLIAKRLSPSGVFITQASSSYFTPNAFATVAATMQAGLPNFRITPLSVNVPSFGEWGFVLGTPVSSQPFNETPLPPQLSFISPRRFEIARVDGALPTAEVTASTLLHPHIYTRYQRDMSQWSY